MDTNKLFNRQYILCESASFRLKWEFSEIGGLFLHRHPELEFETIDEESRKIILLGNIYDSTFPLKTNLEILKCLAHERSFSSILQAQNKYGGHYVIFVETEKDLLIFNDAAAQFELYYNSSFSIFASQLSLIKEFQTLHLNRDQSFREFYTSSTFKKQGILVGNTTPYQDIFHLRPNHFLQVSSKEHIRFFPTLKIQEVTTEDVAEKSAQIIQGFIQAITSRQKSVIGVTAGYDSRILFLSSLESKASYYVSQHAGMDENHCDLSIPTQITSFYRKELRIIKDRELADEQSEEYLYSIDFPRKRTGRSGDFLGSVFINGNVSEVARNYYGYLPNLAGEDLSYLNHFGDLKLPAQEYDAWLKSFRSDLSSFGIHELDLFYWEERLGNWGAKGKSEWSALGDILISPFNCRELLSLLISCPRKDRDAHKSALYDKIILNLDKDGLKFPINPSKKENTIRLMKKLGIYKIYRRIGLKYRLLKF